MKNSIEGNKVRLRLMVFNDLPFLIAVRNESRHFLHDVRKYSLEDSVRWWDKEHPSFLVIELHNGTPVGYIRTSNWDHDNKHVMIGADIHPDHRRNGYAFEAYELYLDELFSHGMNKVSLEVLALNEKAIALYEKLGFIYEGTKREEVLRSGKYIDSIIMSILRSEFQNGT